MSCGIMVVGRELFMLVVSCFIVVERKTKTLITGKAVLVVVAGLVLVVTIVKEN